MLVDPAPPDAKTPTAFVSYSWDDEAHRCWVRDLAARLRSVGVDVTLDRWSLVPGDRLPAFMEAAVRENDYVLIVCTPNYKLKADGRAGGVGYEGDIIAGEIFSGQDHRKFIPILRGGTWVDATPSWLLGKYGIDLRGVPYSSDQFDDLVNTLHGTREQAPPIGARPAPDGFRGSGTDEVRPGTNHPDAEPPRKKIPESRRIAEEAINIFKSSLPKRGWKIRDIYSDHGKDHEVELIEENELTGKIFWVQLKGQKRLSKQKDGTINLRLETDQLRYHLKLPKPMFLVLVDVKKRVGYWACTQQYAMAELEGDSWRRQTYVQIRIDPWNTLSDMPRLRKAVDRAIRLMSRMASERSVLEERLELEAIDPRIKVEITEGPAGRHYTLLNVGDPLIEVLPRGEDSSRQKFLQMIDSGQPAMFDLSEVDFRGSPLIDAMLERAGASSFRLEANRRHKGFFNIERFDGEGRKVGGINGMPCDIVCGRREAHFEARHDLGLIGIRMVMELGRASRQRVSMTISLSGWKGHRLLDLPYFDSILSVFGGWGKGDRLVMDCFVPGVDKISGNLNPDEVVNFGIHDVVDVLRKAREVAACLGINPLIGEGYNTSENFDEAEDLYDMILGAGMEQRLSKGNLGVTVGREQLIVFLDSRPDDEATADVKLLGDGRFCLFGEPVAIERLERSLTDVRLMTPIRAIRRELELDPARREFRLEWRATEKTTMTTRAIPKEGSRSGPDSSDDAEA